MQGFDGTHQVGDGSFVVQVARFDEPVDHFNAWIKRNKIAHFDAKLPHFRGVRNARVVAHFHAGGVAFFVAHIFVDVH